ncbi:hypothetical protein EXU57_21130 [Segetibacter sp. 3557_3]|uniref:hypothetical protein n=1 Tax=Segetibacter sp. 3557_3 TaxID=2547429 RepID=UPI001058B8D1|nr:hypothetical protein [Segetibacter sp. 3557_3]TDH20897.1 hypothetical protein EXU57_21130 [Segetibacter sp. 3557_3]
MKKLTLSLLLAVTIFTSAFATDEIKKANAETKKVVQVNVRTLHTFRSEFGNPNDVEWSLKPDFARASFTVNNERLEAFFDVRGELIGTSKAVTIDQMPVNVKRVFAKRYADYTVKETIRFDGVDESSYYISAENGSKSVILKVSVTGGVSLYQARNK